MTRVLVVDDETSLLLTLVANLELEGFEVIEANSAQRALEILRQEPIDLVLSDIRMPGMNGVEMFRAIRRMRLDMPVVLMTAFAVEGLVQEAVREGVFTVMPKPFDLATLITALSTAARRPMVLVVDDERPVAQTTADVLVAMGIRARALTDGRAALEAVRNGDVDVAVVDMVMPNMTGPEVIEQIIALDPRVACIGISGQDAASLFQRAASKVVSFLRKPIAPHDLASTIANARRTAAQPRH
jgi:DNA-binding NtrC family response regulator